MPKQIQESQIMETAIPTAFARAVSPGRERIVEVQADIAKRFSDMMATITKLIAGLESQVKAMQVKQETDVSALREKVIVLERKNESLGLRSALQERSIEDLALQVKTLAARLEALSSKFDGHNHQVIGGKADAVWLCSDGSYGGVPQECWPRTTPPC